MELFKDVELTVPQSFLNNPHWPRTIHLLKTQKSSCVVTGSFEDLEKLVKNNHRPECQPVVVFSIVLEYMREKCKEKLNRILGEDFKLEDKANGTTQVTFKHHQDPAVCSLQPNFVRRRFITFYQRTAADLKVITPDLRSWSVSELGQRYPLLFFKKTKPVTVIGPYTHVAKLEEFLRQRSRTGSAGPSSGKSSNSLPRQQAEMCPICMEPMASKDTKKLECKHSFCKDCLKQAFSYKPVCPVCGTLYGVLQGTQPEGGRMDYTQDPTPLPGYEKYRTIVIHYYIPSGIQKKEHPNPGQPYQGVSRTAYLPDSSEGRGILKLLEQAFNQRLIFTIGRSTTSGRSNVVTWNDIHHKTSKHGGPSHYGYPDPAYLSRVREELKVKGIK
ncbi:hypothetical protein OJAV_G00095370 [Oryzias javanicus]|uniref:E3 ubiquitin-protein ligase n=1 Tax=Oryzias javanicus TaxID=123683 RepID=A0A437D115_ORYJA|nr:hypothetical protein OJAV_G00095370 [Oryzias javanicus]